MKTITTLLMLALLGATLVAPSVSAKGDVGDTISIDVDLLAPCPPTTVERVVCIVMDIAGPVVWLVWDETWYHVGLLLDLVVKECNHLTSGCPLIISFEEIVEASA